MLISSLEQISNELVKVCFEDGTEVKTTLGVVADMRLFTGKDLSCETLEAFKDASVKYLTLEKASEYLSRRQFSAKEMRDKLIQKGASADTADFCVGKLLSLSLLDDERYAGAVARHYTSKGYGEGRIRAEFIRRGIPRDFWDGALASVSGSDDKIDSYISRRLKNPGDRDEVRKLSASLYRRGFSWDEIKRAMARYTSEDMD